MTVLAGCGGSNAGPAPAKPIPHAAVRQPASKASIPGRKVRPAAGSSPAEILAQTRQSFAQGAREAAAAPAAPGAHAGESRFDSVINMLPIRKPPLPIQQYMSFSGRHLLVVRPAAHDYYCLSLEQRQAAVAAFSAQATELFRRNGIDDASFVVDALRPTGVVHPLARARGSSVSLTPLGRQARGC
jgi:hypothetical protein